MYRLQTTHRGQATVIRAQGELDAYAAPELQAVISASHEDPHVVLDLTAVSFMDSTALGLVARAVRERRELGRKVVVILPQTPARRIFEITTLDRALPVASSISEALLSD